MVKKLKCWRKVNNYHVKEQIGSLTFVFVEKDDFTNTYFTSIRKHKSNTLKVEDKSKDFRTKPEAQNFAESYMKKHNVC